MPIKGGIHHNAVQRRGALHLARQRSSTPRRNCALLTSCADKRRATLDELATETRWQQFINHTALILASMGTRPDTPVRALRRRRDALLTIWLAFLDELDSPVHPRAVECRQDQRLHRDTSTRGLSQIRARLPAARFDAYTENRSVNGS